MKRNTTFIFAGIMSAIIGNAFATGENTVTSKSYVDAQDALKQDVITTGMLELTDKSGTSYLPTLVSYDSTDGLLGNQIGILKDGNGGSIDSLVPSIREFVIPSAKVVKAVVDDTFSFAQTKIPKSGYGATGQASVYNDTAAANAANSWLYDRVKGSGLVTKTDADGIIGERKIFEVTDVDGYHAQNLTQIQKDIQDISIPTVGAMMTAISNGVNAATPTGTANTIANYGANGELDSGIATYTGAAAYNATNDSAKIPTMAGVATYAQAKMTCAGWPDGVEHTDANCWLWYKN